MFTCICCILFIYSVYIPVVSSAAQGGGGSFRNRKPIGEVGCCDEPRMAKTNPLMDRKVVGAVFFGVVAIVAVVTPLTTPGCSVV